MEINLKVTEEQGNLILKALSKLPFEEVNVLINLILIQGEEQVKTTKEPSGSTG